MLVAASPTRANVSRGNGSSTRTGPGRTGSSKTKETAEVDAADAPLYAALVEWRLRQSRAASAPAYVIFPNTTLAAIASARPRTRGRCSTCRASDR